MLEAHGQQPTLVAIAQRVGPIQSMQFLGVQPNGMDVYQVTHEHGVMCWLVALGADGKVTGMSIQPGP